MSAMIGPRILRAARTLGLSPDAHLLIVDADRQTLTHWHAGQAIAIASISTSSQGLGCREGSGRTPTGFHQIQDRIGAGAPLGQVFESRVPTPTVLPPNAWRQHNDSDRILTRILRLKGLEAGTNQGPGIDSFQRLIYLHGTNQEHMLGQPASHGCIRMANHDIADLFARIGDDSTWCWIGRPGDWL